MDDSFASVEWCERGDEEFVAREDWRRFAGPRPSISSTVGEVDLALMLAVSTAPQMQLTPSIARRLSTEPEHFDGLPLTDLLEQCTRRPWRRAALGRLIAGPPGEGTLVLFGSKVDPPLPPAAAAWVTAIDGDDVTLVLEEGPHVLSAAALRADIDAVFNPADAPPTTPTEATTPTDELARRLAAARDGDVVEVPPGTYRGRYVIDRPLTLRGACAEDVVLDPGHVGPALTIETTETVRIEELTFANARSRSGAALYVGAGSDVRLACCLFRSNGAPEGRGGAIHVVRSRLEVVECAFAGNIARLGGALAADDSLVRVQRSTFSDNIALRGGTIACGGRTELTLTATRILRSQASVDGRDLYAFEADDSAPRVVLERTVLFRAAEVRGVALVGPSRLVLHDSSADRGHRRAYAVA